MSTSPIRSERTTESDNCGVGDEFDVIRHRNFDFSSLLFSTMELFTSFPHESGIVMQRGIELGLIVSTTLLGHSLYILNSHDRASSTYPSMDLFFESALLLRVIFAIPRPYIWLNTWKKFTRARAQPTPQLVGEALTRIYTHQNKIEKFLLYFYYGWLLITSVVALFSPYRTDFGRAVWHHLLLNYACIVLHRMTCIGIFYYLVNSDIARGVGVAVIDSESTVDSFDVNQDGVSTECSICYADYTAEDLVRTLRCGHAFHKHCVDEWLTRHRNRCPMCMHVVGGHTRL